MKINDFKNNIWDNSKNYPIHYNKKARLNIFCLGLIGELGEVSDLLKKDIRDNKFSEEELILEIGDLACYTLLLFKHFENLGMIVDNETAYKFSKEISDYQIDIEHEEFCVFHSPTVVYNISSQVGSLIHILSTYSFSEICLVKAAHIEFVLELISLLCTSFNINLEDVFEAHLEKITNRIANNTLNSQKR